MVDELKQNFEKHKKLLDSEIVENVDEILKDLAYNVGAIKQSGSRVDSIIQGMLLHSRGGTGERQDTDINVLLNQYLALAYHSMRAQNSDFEATMENDYDESIGKISVVPQDLGRVFLNILNNACHAILERTKELPDGYSPTLSVSTKSLGDKVEIRIRDNGSGIAEEIKDKIFNPFF
ncbi:MAG: histidine kinase, partial [Nitrospirae bacterium]|nr:histidine kinase [Nitrospirota bacterium]